jgi:hypothetical protein
MTTIAQDKRIPVSMLAIPEDGEIYGVKDGLPVQVSEDSLPTINKSFASGSNYPAKSGLGTDFFSLYDSPFELKKEYFQVGRIINHFCSFQIDTVDSLSTELEFRFKIVNADAPSDADTSISKLVEITNLDTWYGQMTVINTVDSVGYVRCSIELILTNTTDDTIIHRIWYDRLGVQQMFNNDYNMFCEAKFITSDSGNNLDTVMIKVETERVQD